VVAGLDRFVQSLPGALALGCLAGELVVRSAQLGRARLDARLQLRLQLPQFAVRILDRLCTPEDLRLHQRGMGAQFLLLRGYPQFPWENVVNDWYASSAWDRPPTSQLVVLHPAPGLAMDIGSATTAELDVALLVHAIGYVHYIGDDRAWYVGGSATLAVPADDDLGLGYGLTIHCGNTTEKSVFPAIDVGLLWHEGTDDDGWMLSLGFDAARLLAPSN